MAVLIAEFRFDWFQFTLPNAAGGALCDQSGDAQETAASAAAIEWALEQGLYPGAVRRGSNGYRTSLPFRADPTARQSVATLSSGSETCVMPNVCITGLAAGVLGPSAQAAFPGLRLSRADVCLDRSAPDLYATLRDVAEGLSADNPKLGPVLEMGSEKGRTFYLGSASSRVRLRVYQKDLERVARGEIQPQEADPDLTRIEFVIRPQSRSKAGSGRLSPAELLQSSVWARRFVERLGEVLELGGGRVGRVAVEREIKVRTLDDTVAHGVRQYGPSFARLAAHRLVAARHGGDYAAALLTPEQVEREAGELFLRLLREGGLAARIIAEARLDRVESDAERVGHFVRSFAREAVVRTVELSSASDDLLRSATGVAHHRAAEVQASALECREIAKAQAQDEHGRQGPALAVLDAARLAAERHAAVEAAAARLDALARAVMTASGSAGSARLLDLGRAVAAARGIKASGSDLAALRAAVEPDDPCDQGRALHQVAAREASVEAMILGWMAARCLRLDPSSLAVSGISEAFDPLAAVVAVLANGLVGDGLRFPSLLVALLRARGLSAEAAEATLSGARAGLDGLSIREAAEDRARWPDLLRRILGFGKVMQSNLPVKCIV